ncbi:helix-turn-helix transcriptional regulator [Ideonella sp.]|uniref:helix-turn-helix transcriptional regulator n=1 Tax=Ideonella sp. TaxID=1929293 RepID=UPI003BB71BB6
MPTSWDITVRNRGLNAQEIAAKFDELADSAVVSDATVAAVRGVTRNTIWRWTSAGKMPQPQRVAGTTRWLVGDLRRAFNLPGKVAAK